MYGSPFSFNRKWLMKILMVCLGNICRSPIAEGVMLEKFRKHSIEGKVDSAGVISFHAGEQPDRRAIEISLENGIDISGQKARQFRLSDFHDFDLILTMDNSVHREIAGMAGNESDRQKVKLFLPFAGMQQSENVPDPYYGGKEGFQLVFSMIDEGCDRIIQKVQNRDGR
jgi:protein-tyrosine phosphatase